MKNRSKSNQLEEMDSYKKLREIEKKMQENENVIFSLTSFVDGKLDDSDYNGIMKECMDLQAEINNELVKKTLSVKLWDELYDIEFWYWIFKNKIFYFRFLYKLIHFNLMNINKLIFIYSK